MFLFSWEAYHAKTGKEKHELILKYQNEGGIKNLGWVSTYLESSEHVEKESAEFEKGYMTMHTILGHHGFKVGVNLTLL